MILQPQTIDDIRANREEWATALESGKYEQSIGKFRDPFTFSGTSKLCLCATGVLTDISIPGTWVGERFVPSTIAEGYLWDTPVGKAVAIDEETTRMIGRANDNGLPFDLLAAMIRSLPLPTEVPS